MCARPRRLLTALWWPHFRLQVLQEPGTEAQPAVLVEVQRRRSRVQLCNEAAHEAGVRVGMSVNRARALCELLLRDPDPERWADASAALLQRARQRLSDRLEALAPGFLLLGVEASIVQDPTWRAAVETLTPRFGPPRIGVGTNRFVARTAAVHLSTAPGWEQAAMVPAGSEALSLANIPLHALPLEPQERRRLLRVGISTLGGFAAASPDVLSLQLGHRTAHLQALSVGRDTRTVTPQEEAGPWCQERSADTPWVHREALLFVFRGLLDALIQPLMARGLRIRELEVRLSEGELLRAEVALRVRQPTLCPDAWWRLWRVHLERLPLEGPVDHLALHAHPIAAHTAEGRWLEMPGHATPEQLWDTWLELSERVPTAHWWVAREQGSLWVEERSRLDPAAPTLQSATRHVPEPLPPSQPLPTRAWRLYQPPRPVEVHQRDARPWRVTIQERCWRVESTEGPWRIESHWWETPKRATFWEARLQGGPWIRLRQEADGAWCLAGEAD